MFNRPLTTFFGNRNERVIRQLRHTASRINALEPACVKLTDEGLRAKTDEFKQRYAAGESLDKLLPEAFAVVREASKRKLGLRPYDVQLIGGVVLHQGKIAEMRTGEGKTLVATLPVYLNAIAGQGVHLVTVNDYLARRDAAQMGVLYNFLGLSVGVVYPGMDHADKAAAYNADITYGTNNEFGFDYLRDNMALSKEQRYQRGLNFAIVDEVDSILIDEARTPLIISGPADDSVQLYLAVNKIVPNMVRQTEEDGPGDFWVDEKQKQVQLSEEGMQHAEELLHANGIYQRDVDYIVRDGEVIIVDEFTGRTLAGRRWSDGLHQAVEAKEGVPIQRENQTMATVTFQNLFRMYKKLSGMTGTAFTEAFEFNSIYGLDVVVIPTHKPMIRVDNQDMIFLSTAPKYRAVIEDVKTRHAKGQPVLVGTTSIEVSELLSKELDAAGVVHEVLNAKQHEREAYIVAQAGALGQVTIATNMAGRGTDIVLGGSLETALAALPAEATDAEREAVHAKWQAEHDKVLAAGGLHIVGTERHESRRIDNQLRGRSGRQGDPGSSRFFLSLDDNLLRIFGGEGLVRWMKRFGMKDDDALEDRMVSRQIEKAQRKVEQHNFDIRKHLLEFDDVANDQRKVIYTQRDELLEGEEVAATVADIREDVVRSMVLVHVPADSIDEQWDIPGLDADLGTSFGLSLGLVHWFEQQSEVDSERILAHVLEGVNDMFRAKEEQIGAETMRQLEKHVMLTVVDDAWKDHLSNMDFLRQGINLVGYAQQDPKQAFKREAFRLFSEMLDRIKAEVVQMLARIRVRSEEEVAEMEAEQQRIAARLQQQMLASGGGAPAEGAFAAAPEESDRGVATAVRRPVQLAGPKVGRNDLCPCGSGKKYKHCHGRLN